MILRISASGAVLLGCAYLGLLFAASYKKRVMQLAEFENALVQLEFDIDFLNIPLAESLKKIEKNCEKGVKDVFSYVRESIELDRCINMRKLWERAFSRFKEELFLSEDDKRILIEFSKNLGSGDRVNEKNNIKLTLARLGVAGEEAREVAKRNSKMCRGLGLLAGIFIVIVLI